VAAGLVAMGAGVTVGSALGVVIAGMVVGETGFMLASVALTIAATGSLDDEHGGLAAGLINTASQLGAGIGLGVVATVVVATAPAGTTAMAVRNGFLTCLVFSALAATLVGAGLRSQRSVAEAAPAPLRGGAGAEGVPPVSGSDLGRSR
jgi:hypothetical protein